MRLGLVQSRHNAMYDFLNPEFSFSVPQCLAMQQQQLEQNLQLLEEAAGQGYDLLVTTECINYIRTGGGNRPEDRAFYPPLTGAPVQALADAARRAHSWLVAGLGFAQADHVYNGALVLTGKESCGRYTGNCIWPGTRAGSLPRETVFVYSRQNSGGSGSVSAGTCSFPKPPAPWPCRART